MEKQNKDLSGLSALTEELADPGGTKLGKAWAVTIEPVELFRSNGNKQGNKT